MGLQPEHSQPVIGGYEYPLVYGPGNTKVMRQSDQLRMLYICRAMSGNSIHIGKMINRATCNINVDNKEVSTSAFQVLFLGQDETTDSATPRRDFAVPMLHK
jgi:hypothetical protein